MTVDVHGNPLFSMGFGHMYQELHHTKHHQRRKASTKNIPEQDPKAKGKPHTACGSPLPCSAISDSRTTVSASREQQTGILAMAHCRGHTNPGLFQDKTTGAARHGSDFTNPKSLKSQLLFTRAQSCTGSCRQPQSLSPPQECSPTPSPVPYHSSGWLSSAPRRKIISAAHEHELSLSTMMRMHFWEILKRRGREIHGDGRTEMDWHTQPQLSGIKMKLHPCGFPRKRLL